MNRVNYRFSTGEKVFAVNTYPSGAKIFEGIISKVIITEVPFYKENKREKNIQIRYELDGITFKNFPEKLVFATEQSAKAFKEKWLKKIENEKHTHNINS